VERRDQTFQCDRNEHEYDWETGRDHDRHAGDDQAPGGVHPDEHEPW
jgi:hypothetical protein